jgi:2-C-methyl-D-erythritol 4-phosphate cytidylyltransferase
VILIDETKAKVAAVIPAAGSGRRMQAECNKVWLELNGVSILEHTLKVFQAATVIDRIVLVINPAEFERFAIFLRDQAGSWRCPVDLVLGGAARQDSVANGLKFLKQQSGWGQNRDLVVVHDAARALLTEALLTAAIEMAVEYRAVGVGTPVKDTIKQVNRDGLVVATLKRDLLWAVQTPQVFDFALLDECYRKAATLDSKFTDDCGVVECFGYPVKLMCGSYENLKLTTPEDLILAETILRRRDA